MPAEWLQIFLLSVCLAVCLSQIEVFYWRGVTDRSRRGQIFSILENKRGERRHFAEWVLLTLPVIPARLLVVIYICEWIYFFLRFSAHKFSTTCKVETIIILLSYWNVKSENSSTYFWYVGRDRPSSALVLSSGTMCRKRLLLQASALIVFWLQLQWK